MVQPEARGTRPVRVGQFTGWHGDRADGMAELIASDVDVLTGDYLAELTMLVLRKNQLRGGAGYVEAFPRLLGSHLTEIAARGIRVITNAGGLDPEAAAAEIRRLCSEAGVDLTVATVGGDDLRESLFEDESRREFVNYDDGSAVTLDAESVLSANAYLGAWPAVAALQAGAQIVVCPRVTDASLVVAGAAWWHDWDFGDFDKLAGGVVAGHIIECGAQATGGNFSFFFEHADLGLPGMPIADIDADGSCWIGKSRGSGGMVTVDTVRAQLFYEILGNAYQNPDVVADFSSPTASQAGENRVFVSAAKGFPPTNTTKLSLTYEGGYRNSLTIGITGRKVPEKIAWLTRQVHDVVGPAHSFEEFRWSSVGPANVNGSFEESTTWLVVTARHADRSKVDRAHFADQIVQLGTSTIPGFYLTTPPQRERLFAVQWPTLVSKSAVATTFDLGDGVRRPAPWPPITTSDHLCYPVAERAADPVAVPVGEGVEIELGDLVGTRSGDKADIANIGVWARSPKAHAWLQDYLTVDRLRELLPETRDLVVDRHSFSNLFGLNFVVHGYLERGVSSCTRIDPQGKGLGEYLGSRLVTVPRDILPASDSGERQ